MRKLLLAAAMICAAMPVYASNATYTATVSDTDGQVWINGTWTASLVLPSGPFGNVKPTVGGVEVPSFAKGVLDTNGLMTVTVTNPQSLDQTGAVWSITVCPNTSISQFSDTGCVTVPVKDTGGNLTSRFTGLKAPRFPAGPNAYGYSDAEVVPPAQPGVTYYNTGNVPGYQGMRVWDGKQWNGVGAGGGGTPAGTNYDVQINLSNTFGADPGHFTYNPTTHTLKPDIVVLPNDNQTGHQAATANLVTGAVGAVTIGVAPYLCNGDGNCTPAINQAINDLCSTGGGKVLFGKGQYFIQPDSVTPPAGYPSGYAIRIGCSNITLQGAGPHATTLYFRQYDGSPAGSGCPVNPSATDPARRVNRGSAIFIDGASYDMTNKMQHIQIRDLAIDSAYPIQSTWPNTNTYFPANPPTMTGTINAGDLTTLVLPSNTGFENGGLDPRYLTSNVVTGVTVATPGSNMVPGTYDVLYDLKSGGQPLDLVKQAKIRVVVASDGTVHDNPTILLPGDQFSSPPVFSFHAGGPANGGADATFNVAIGQSTAVPITIAGAGPGGADWTGYITGIIDGTHATISPAASTPVTNANWTAPMGASCRDTWDISSKGVWISNLTQYALDDFWIDNVNIEHFPGELIYGSAGLLTNSGVRNSDLGWSNGDAISVGDDFFIQSDHIHDLGANGIENTPRNGGTRAINNTFVNMGLDAIALYDTNFNNAGNYGQGSSIGRNQVLGNDIQYAGRNGIFCISCKRMLIANNQVLDAVTGINLSSIQAGLSNQDIEVMNNTARVENLSGYGYSGIMYGTGAPSAPSMNVSIHGNITGSTAKGHFLGNFMGNGIADANLHANTYDNLMINSFEYDNQSLWTTYDDTSHAETNGFLLIGNYNINVAQIRPRRTTGYDATVSFTVGNTPSDVTVTLVYMSDMANTCTTRTIYQKSAVPAGTTVTIPPVPFVAYGLNDTCVNQVNVQASVANDVRVSASIHQNETSWMQNSPATTTSSSTQTVLPQTVDPSQPADVATKNYVDSHSSTYTLPAATTTTLGGVKPDGTSITVDVDGTIHSVSSGGGTGTVTNFSAANLDPLFTSSVAAASTTPALTFGLNAAAAHSFFGNCSGTNGAPNYCQPRFSDIAGTASSAQLPTATTSALGGVKPDGTTVTIDVNGTLHSSGGSVSGLTTGYITQATSATAIGNSFIDYGVTNVGAYTSTKDIYAPAFHSTDTAGTGFGFVGTEGTAPAGVSGSDGLWADLTAHRLMMNNNNTGSLTLVGIGTAGTSGHFIKFASNGIDLIDGGTGPSGIANVTVTLPTTAIAANTCTTAATATMTGLTTSSAFSTAFATDPSAVTGWGSSGGLSFVAWPTANTLNWKVCNVTSASITPGAMTLNVGAN